MIACTRASGLRDASAMLQPHEIAHRLGRTVVGRTFLSQLTAHDVARQTFRRVNERPVEYAFAFERLNRLQPRTVLVRAPGPRRFQPWCGPVASSCTRSTTSATTGPLG